MGISVSSHLHRNDSGEQPRARFKNICEMIYRATSGAEALIFKGLTARINPCPDTKRLKGVRAGYQISDLESYSQRQAALNRGRRARAPTSRQAGGGDVGGTEAFGRQKSFGIDGGNTFVGGGPRQARGLRQVLGAAIAVVSGRDHLLGLSQLQDGFARVGAG